MPKQLRPFPWPSSGIHRDVLHELRLVSQETGRPITAIIADAVHASLNARFEQRQQPIGFQTTQPQSAS